MTVARDTSQNLGNRRTHRRAELRSPVLIDAASSYHTGRCRDVSPVGLGIEVSAALPVGMPVDVYFELPTGVAVEARAQVARCDGQTAGIHFNDLSAEGMQALRAYCDTWRQKLLANCARRVDSVRDLQPQSFAPPHFPNRWEEETQSEATSEIRLRKALRPLADLALNPRETQRKK